MTEKLEVIHHYADTEDEFYEVGIFTFDQEDKDLGYIDGAIAAWTAWREYVAGSA